MKFRASRPVAAVSMVSLLTVTACTDPGQIGGDERYRNTQQGVLIGSALGAAVGAITGGENKSRGAIQGAILGAGAGGVIGAVLDKQEADLRRDLGDDVSITNTGDRLIVTMPQDILFATGSATLRPDLQSDIRTVAASLLEYPNSTVQIVGHTDNVGDADYNFSLSNRRANSVANVLIGASVPSSRIQTIGRGEDQPIASNLTSEGRRQNRRVDIVILPYT